LWEVAVNCPWEVAENQCGNRVIIEPYTFWFLKEIETVKNPAVREQLHNHSLQILATPRGRI